MLAELSFVLSTKFEISLKTEHAKFYINMKLCKHFYERIMLTENKLQVFLSPNNRVFVKSKPSNSILIFHLLLHLFILSICLCLRKH